MAKSKFDANYNFIGFEPPKAGWTAWLGASRAYASELLALKVQEMFTFSQPGVPFIVRVAEEDGHVRAYVEVDFSDRANLHSYVQWNAAQARMLSANVAHPIRVKVTFRSPLSIADAQALVDATGLRLEQTIFVGRSTEGEPYNGGTLSDGVDSIIRLGALESVWEEKKVQLDGVMVIEGVLSRGDALHTLLEAPQVYMVDVTAEFVLKKIRTAGITDLQGIVVPSPYWWLYLDWLSGRSE